MKYNKFLVTGSAGFIGFHLSRALLQEGYEVIGYDNLNDYYDPILKQARLKILNTYANFIFYKEDIADCKTLEKVIRLHNIKFIINLAAQAGVRYSITSPQTYMYSNVIGMFNILECCRNCEVEQLLYASSSSVYGNSQEEKFKETQMVDHPISLYAATKKCNELIAHVYSNNFSINTVGLRFFTVYGPFGRPDMAYYHFTEKIIKGEPIQVYNYGNQYRDFTYIDDLINGILRLIKRRDSSKMNGEYKVYNIGNGVPIKLLDFICTLQEAIGKKAKLEYVSRMTGDVEKTYADITLLQEETGYNPSTNIKQGIEAFYNWYQTYIDELEKVNK
ncbi:MAG: NAD-dependent epimerase/dehydratase [Anaerocolumna sp.]|jgi:UDP-glucuronate 4-epimerase|nr:NAD-dependent epimerase/dehydratase [Anaerocolumna sp.]